MKTRLAPLRIDLPKILFGIVLLLVLATAIYFYVTRQQDVPSQAAKNATNVIIPTHPPTEWNEFQHKRYSIRFHFPQDYFFLERNSIKPVQADTRIVFAPQQERDILSDQTPIIILTIYQGSGESLFNWFQSHATTKAFDDPTVSMKDSTYFFRQFKDLTQITLIGEPALSFTSTSFAGEMKHTVVTHKSLIYDFSVTMGSHASLVNQIYDLMLRTITFTSP
jgi:hypothetical protein